MNPRPNDDTVAKTRAAPLIIDHLVDALGGEPACTIRRAMVLIDIDGNPGTTQSAVQERLSVNKSALNRDIEWLYDYGCILRTQDGRAVELRTCGYAKRHLQLALEYFGYSHKDLQNFLLGIISLFGQHKPTLRDAKIVAVIGEHESISRQRILDALYDGPSSTDNRAVNNLINFGLVQRQDDEQA